MPEKTPLSGIIVQFDLDLVGRESNTDPIDEAQYLLHLAGLSLSNTLLSSKYLVFSSHFLPFTIEFTRLIYSRQTDVNRIASPLMKP